MSPARLRASLALWKRREAYRKRRHTTAVTKGDAAAVKHWGDRLREARAMVTLRQKQIAAHDGIKPRIITAAQLGLRFQWVFGPVGPLSKLTGHYTAGPRALTGAEGVVIARQAHAQHVAQGWGGLSYSYVLCDDGTLICGNPVGRKAAHVAGHNTGNLGVNCPGTTGDTPTAAQRATYRWLLANAHTRKMPKAHRQPVDLRTLTRFGHNDLNATACPGEFKPMFLKEAR